MPDSDSQPTVLVKKSDGTFARLSLAEVKKMQQSKATTFPRNDRKTETMPRPKVHKDDFRSPLEDKLPQTNDSRPATSQARVGQVEEIIKRLSFKVAPENNNRLRTIVQLRLKEIRDEEQTREVLARRTIEGGLGLTNEQADEVEKLISRNNNNPPQAYKEPPVPTNAAPFNSFIAKPKQPAPPISTAKPKVVSDILRLNSQPVVRRSVQDIARPRSDQMGPAGEISSFTLVDFRRLSSNPTESASRLKQKLFNLRDESYVLYLDGLSAWRQSPLYDDYVKVLALSLAKRQSLVALTADKSKIQLAEMRAIAQMEEEL